MEVGAFLLASPAQAQFLTVSSSDREARDGEYTPQLWPVVGRKLCEEWAQRIQKCDIPVLHVFSDADAKIPDRIRTYLSDGLRQFLFVSLCSYAEIDLVDFLRFHQGIRRAITEASDSEGRLGITLADQSAFEVSNSSNLACEYRFAGYAKRLTSAARYRALVSDALSRRCGLKPLGTQVGESLWVDESARLAPSVRLSAPCYVGARTVLHDGVSVEPFASIESDCVVGAGTEIAGSSILPGTLLAPGLRVRRALVKGSFFQDLDRGEVLDLQEVGLADSRTLTKSPVTEMFWASAGARA